MKENDRLYNNSNRSLGRDVADEGIKRVLPKQKENIDLMATISKY